MAKLTEEEIHTRQLARYAARYAVKRLDPEFRQKNNDRMKEWAKTHKRNVQHQDLMKRYGITIDEFEKLLIEQDNVCAACHQPEQRRHRGGVCRLAVDHDHETGKVRGLLCSHCNVILGMANDDPSILEGIIEYLRGAN